MKKNKKIVHFVPLKTGRFKVNYIFCLLLIFGLFGRLVTVINIKKCYKSNKHFLNRFASNIAKSLCSQ